MGGNPVNAVDPKGLDVLVFGGGGTVTVGGGVDASGGVAIDLDSGKRSFFRSVGVTVGANVSADVFAGYFPDASLCDLEGRAKVFNAVFGPISFAFFFSDGPGLGSFRGLTVGIGPTVPVPVMGSAGFVDTTLTPIR